MTGEMIAFEKWVQETVPLEKFALPQIGVFGSFTNQSHPNDIDLLLDEPIPLYQTG